MARRMLLVFALVVLLAAADDDKLNKKMTDESESWAGWLKDKVKQGIVFKKEQLPIEDTDTLKSRDKIEEVITGGKQIPYDSVGPKHKAYETANEAYYKAEEKAQQAKLAASETAKEASNKATSMKDAAIDKAHDVKHKAQQFAKQASEKTSMVKDKAKQKAEAAAHTAEEVQETMARKTEVAKEKATGDVEDAKYKAGEWAEEDLEEGESTNWVKEKAKEGYEGVKKRASRTLHNAKEMAKDMVMPQYDDDDL